MLGVVRGLGELWVQVADGHLNVKKGQKDRLVKVYSRRKNHPLFFCYLTVHYNAGGAAEEQLQVSKIEHLQLIIGKLGDAAVS